MSKASFKPVFSKLITRKKEHRCGPDKNKKPNLTFVKKDTYVYVRNRHYNGRRKLFKVHGCVLKKNRYYLAKFTLYKCEDCGQFVSIRTCYKRISREEAINSGYKIRNLFVFSKDDLE